MKLMTFCFFGAKDHAGSERQIVSAKCKLTLEGRIEGLMLGGVWYLMYSGLKLGWFRLGIILCCKQKFDPPKNSPFLTLDSALGPQPQKSCKKPIPL